MIVDWLGRSVIIQLKIQGEEVNHKRWANEMCEIFVIATLEGDVKEVVFSYVK